MGCLGTLRGRDTKGEWSTQLGSLTQYIELLTSPIAAHYWVCYEADKKIPIRNLLLIYISSVGSICLVWLFSTPKHPQANTLLSTRDKGRQSVVHCRNSIQNSVSNRCLIEQVSWWTDGPEEEMKKLSMTLVLKGQAPCGDFKLN